MVLFRRKPVQYLSRPVIEDDNSEIWVIPETNEVFTSYEPYLQRMDFYKQRRFICEVTGHSGLTFFEAQKSEMEESREVNSSFPDALREPILRRIQFSTTSRVDSLVDEVYEEFKKDFYPGEQVLILLEDKTRIRGMIRDKANFPEQRNANGTLLSPAYARYLVKILDRPNEEALLDQDHITRDRNSFTKVMLRAFIRNNVTRESWAGAPWLVKTHIAEEFRISTEVPNHLQYGARVAEKKGMKKANQEGFFGFFSSQERFPNFKSGPKGQKPKPSMQDMVRTTREQHFEELQRALNGNPTFVVAAPAPRLNRSHDFEIMIPTGKGAQTTSAIVIDNELSVPPPPLPIKYPIEDLHIEPRRDGNKRPLLKFLDDQASLVDDELKMESNLKPESIGLFLETWNILNVFCEVFQLDSFTFDDFVEAMRFSSEDLNCELFVEVHCAVLKTLVSAEDDEGGAVQISLPELPNKDDSDENKEQEPTPEPEPVLTRRTTRSSLAKAEAEMLRKAQENGTRLETSESRIHRATEMFDDYGWIDRLRKRDFRNGGWELAMVGLLHQLSLQPRMARICNEILKYLAPLDAEPTLETARLQYATLDINLRIQALQVICMLSLETKAIRNYLEECSNQMTEHRKEKLEYQRQRKAALEELRQLHEERKALQPEKGKSPSPVPELENLEDSKATVEDDNETEAMETDDEEPSTRALRGGIDRTLERKRKLEEERERKEQVTKQPKESKQYQRVLTKIEVLKAKIGQLEQQISVVDNDLREADCPRTRCLGKDRFHNRYWWFERNAMPFSGMPNGSTSEADYANGRLWIQGPDEMEQTSFIDVTEEQQRQYFRQFQTTPAERRKMEEANSVLNARHWGYYDEPESVAELLGWLDKRGERESKLRKELLLWQNTITEYMRRRRSYLERSTERSESEDLPVKRVSTRHKTYIIDDNRHRCLKWRNTTALKENGHLHVDSARPGKRTRKGGEETKSSTLSNKQGKPVTRQSIRRRS